MILNKRSKILKLLNILNIEKNGQPIQLPNIYERYGKIIIHTDALNNEQESQIYYDLEFVNISTHHDYNFSIISY